MALSHRALEIRRRAEFFRRHIYALRKMRLFAPASAIRRRASLRGARDYLIIYGRAQSTIGANTVGHQQLTRRAVVVDGPRAKQSPPPPASALAAARGDAAARCWGADMIPYADMRRAERGREAEAARAPLRCGRRRSAFAVTSCCARKPCHAMIFGARDFLPPRRRAATPLYSMLYCTAVACVPITTAVNLRRASAL